MADLDQPAEVTETWTYQGRRTGRTGTTLYLFDDGSEHGRVFTKSLSANLIGGIYDVGVQHTGDKVRVHTLPAWTGQTHTDTDQVDHWRAEDRAARLRSERIRLERRLTATDSSLDEAFAPLEQLARHSRTHAARDALVAEVIRRLHQTWR